jgi:hypothetical protein
VERHAPRAVKKADLKHAALFLGERGTAMGLKRIATKPSIMGRRETDRPGFSQRCPADIAHCHRAAGSSAVPPRKFVPPRFPRRA